MSNIKIKEDYQLNSILDIYQGTNQNKATALDYPVIRIPFPASPLRWKKEKQL